MLSPFCSGEWSLECKPSLTLCFLSLLRRAKPAQYVRNSQTTYVNIIISFQDVSLNTSVSPLILTNPEADFFYFIILFCHSFIEHLLCITYYGGYWAFKEKMLFYLKVAQSLLCEIHTKPAMIK